MNEAPMQKTMTFDSLLTDMIGRSQEADTVSGTLADGAINVILANIHFEIFKASLVTYEKNLAQIAQQLGARPSFIERTERVQIEPHTPEDNWVGPRIARAVA